MSYAKLKGRIIEIFGSQEAFANEMGISKSGMSMRLNNKVKWTLEEVYKAKNLLQIEDAEISAYFFTPKVR